MSSNERNGTDRRIQVLIRSSDFDRVFAAGVVRDFASEVTTAIDKLQKVHENHIYETIRSERRRARINALVWVRTALEDAQGPNPTCNAVIDCEIDRIREARSADRRAGK